MKKSILLFTLFFSLPVLAHTDHSDTFFSAFYHPFSGWDHLLTMLIIGMMACFFPLRRGVLLPIIFVLSFSLAGIVASSFVISSTSMQLLNQLIWISLIGLPIVHFFMTRLSAWGIFSLTGLIGGIHGFTHGVEMSFSSGTVFLGLILATTCIHIIGFGVAQLCVQKNVWIIRAFTVSSGFLGGLALIQSI